MSVCHRRRLSILALAVAPVLMPAAGASAATYVFTNPNGGALNASTNYAPSGIPGAADTLRIDALPTIPGFLDLRLAANQSIGRIELNHFAPTTITSNLNSSSQPFTLTLSTGQLAFTDAISEAPDVALDTLFIYSPIAGGAGLTKSGPGFAFLSGNNLYTGGTTISGPGGLSVATDVALGDASNAINFNQNGALRAVSSFATSRTVNVASTGGRIESYGTLTLNGPVTGSGVLSIDRFTLGTVVMAADNSFSGTLAINQANTVRLTGRLASASNIRLGGTLDLGSDRSNAAAPVLPTNIGIESAGGTITLAGGASANSSVTLGALRLDSGTTTLNLEINGGGGAAMTFSQFDRADRSTLVVRGRSLGTAPLGTNVGVINVTGGTLPLVGGGGTTATNDSIVPFIFGNANVTGGTSQVSAVDASFVTRGANGLRPLAESDFATAFGNATDNVRVSDTVVTQNTATTVNALAVRDTLASAGQSGVTGTGTISVTSGAILAVTDLSGEELFIDNPLNFGAAEGIVHTAPTADGHSQITLRGAITGSNGLTKSGAGELFLENTASTFGGVTTINAGTITYSGNVNANTAGALGSSSADVVINAGVTANEFVGLRAATAGSTFGRNIVVANNENDLAFIGTYGGYGANFTGQITVTGLLNLLGDTEPEPLTFSGPIVGGGGLQEPGSAEPLLQFLRITGANTYSGGTVIRAGRWEVGSNTALGTGTVYFVGNNDGDAEQTGTLQSFGGARSLANAFVLRATPVFGGTDPLTLTGPIDLGSVPREIDVTSTADVTFAGIASRDGIVKTGSGRLVLSGANTFNGQTIVSDGELRVANNAGLGVATGPTGTEQATFLTGVGVLELVGGVNTGESIFLGAGGAPITAAVAGGNIRSVSGNNTISGQVAFDNVATIGVDAGSTLTLSEDGVDNTDDASATLRKVGPGTLSVKNVRLPALAVSQGIVRVLPTGGTVGTSRVDSITVAAGAAFDLNNHSLVIDHTGTSPIQFIRALLASGQITTSATQAGARIGYAEASSLFAANSFPQNFEGESVDNTTLLLMQTLGGDANLDRAVNFSDLVTLAQNYNTGPDQVWRNGDFNYDGTVGFADLVALAQNYNQTATAAFAESSFSSSFAADWARAQSLVPEPGTLSMLALLLPLARRRR